MRTLLSQRERVRLALIALALALALLFRSDAGPLLASGNFNPTTTLILSSHALGANADSTSTFNIAAGDLLGAPVALTPQAATINASPGTIPSGLGDVVGTLSSDSTLGLNNGPCNFPITVSMTLMSATADNSAGNLIYPSNPHEAGPQGALSPLRQDTYTVTPDDIPGNGNDTVGAAGAQSAPSGPANGLPSHVDRYPGFLSTVFDPDGAGPNPPLAPLARYSGSTVVLTSTIVLIQVMVFAPGSLAAYAPPATLSDLSDATLGYASILVLNDPTATPAPGGIVTDICSHLGGTSTLYGITKTNPCAENTMVPCNTTNGINSPLAGADTGRVRYANPTSAGTRIWYGFHISARDLDNDGIENSLDTCPYHPNIDGDSRLTAGPDGDMIDSACDPTPNEDTNAGDHDGDGFDNAADNCPLVPNPTQAEAEDGEPANIAAPRGGSTTDSIGDECDGPETGTQCSNALDDDLDGLVNDGCPTVGSAVAETTCTFSTSSEVDNDRDGYPNDGCPAVGAPETGTQCWNYVSDDDDNGDTLVNSGDVVNDGCPAQGGPEHGCLNKTDDDADSVVNDGCPSSSRVANGHYHTTLTVLPQCIGGTDADGDGWCATGQSGVPNDPSDSDASRTPETFSQLRAFPVAHSGSGSNPPASREPIQVCNDGIDNDGDTLVDLLDGTSSSGSTTDDCRPPDSIFTSGPDTDGDGSRDAVEIYAGTDPLSRCGRGLETGAGPPPSRGWAWDLRGDFVCSGDKVNVSDLGTFVAGVRRLSVSPGQPGFDRRWDLRPGSTIGPWIGIADMAAITTKVPPEMYGVRAFGFFSLCSAHPVYGD
jgi:hypothetical protein